MHSQHLSHVSFLEGLDRGDGLVASLEPRDTFDDASEGDSASYYYLFFGSLSYSTTACGFAWSSDIPVLG
jgi:hypothetical protein